MRKLKQHNRLTIDPQGKVYEVTGSYRKMLKMHKVYWSRVSLFLGYSQGYFSNEQWADIHKMRLQLETVDNVLANIKQDYTETLEIMYIDRDRVAGIAETFGISRDAADKKLTRAVWAFEEAFNDAIGKIDFTTIKAEAPATIAPQIDVTEDIIVKTKPANEPYVLEKASDESIARVKNLLKKWHCYRYGAATESRESRVYEEMEFIKRAIDWLLPDDKKYMTAVYLEGRPLRESAENFGFSPEGLRKRLLKVIKDIAMIYERKFYKKPDDD